MNKLRQDIMDYAWENFNEFNSEDTIKTCYENMINKYPNIDNTVIFDTVCDIVDEITCIKFLYS